jgi:hypothetical protein
MRIEWKNEDGDGGLRMEDGDGKVLLVCFLIRTSARFVLGFNGLLFGGLQAREF